jgi:hypothetical protein
MLLGEAKIEIAQHLVRGWDLKIKDALLSAFGQVAGPRFELGTFGL